jgi:hypothetical protein
MLKKMRTPLPVLLASTVLCISLGNVLASTPAYAQGVRFCVSVTANGGFNDNQCTMGGGTRTWAVGYPGAGGKINVCFKVVAPMGSFDTGTCFTAGGTKEWELQNTTVPVPPAQGQMGPVAMASTVGGVKVEVKCTKGTFKSQPKETGLSSDGLIELKACEVAKPAGCTVSEPLNAEFNGQLEESSGKLVLDKLTGSKSEEGFAEITLSGEGCTLKGKTEKIKGTQKCGFDKEIETLAFEHEIICKAAGSKLKLEAEPATFEGTASKVLTEIGSTKVAWSAFG